MNFVVFQQSELYNQIKTLIYVIKLGFMNSRTLVDWPIANA